ncbi:MAG: cell division protein FtsA [Clostridia bacterium]|nr:cell division protein FtsA [Clostridia bacterium]MBR6504128.1 cell division protein FtsA [Clostridia bacterium]
MAIGDIIVSLDIGASKTAAVVGQVNKFGEIEVVGHGLADSSGIKKGKILNNEPVAKSIVRAITEAEETSGLYINSAYVNIKGISTRIEKIRFKGDVERPDDGLSYNDINKMIETINLGLRKNDNEQIVSIVPTKFNVNDRDYKEEPIGAFAKYFIMDADVVIADKQTIESIEEVMRLAELKIDGYVLETFANSNVVLMPEEKEMGVLMLDIGAAHTEISVYKNSNLEFNTTLPVGGDHITSDIAISLNIGLDEAEKLKRQYNLAIEAMITNNHDVKLNTKKTLEDKEDIVTCSDIVKIIEARVKEVYQITRKIMAENNLIGKVECVVLTGQGFSNIGGTEELAVLTLKINQVRTCSPKLINVIKPQHALAYGMLKYISTMGLGKDVNSDVEIVEEPSFKDRIIGIFSKAKEKINSIQKKESQESEE